MNYDSQKPIWSLGLSNRATNALIRNNISTIEMLLSLSEEKLRSMRGIGNEVLGELLDVQKSYSNSGVANKSTRSCNRICTELTPIVALGLSSRATNALLRNGITNARILLSLPISKFKTMRGVGATVLNEILNMRESLHLVDNNEISEEATIYTFGDFLKKICQNDKWFTMIVSLYNNYTRGSMQKFADEYAITRSRIQQIVSKYTDKLQISYKSGTINSRTVSLINQYAFDKTEINKIVSDDPFFTGKGIVYLLTNFKDSKYRIFTNNNLNGEWLVFSDDNIEKSFDMLIADLKHSTAPLLIANVSLQYGINEDMLMSIKGVIEKDGYVTHENNKHSTGKDRNYIIRKYLESVNRPASINEITDNTPLSFQQVRGAIADKSRYVNVGKSIYDLSDRKYEDKTIDELAAMILAVEDRALKGERVLDFIKKFRDVDNYSIIHSLLSSSLIKSIGNYYLLADWSEEKISRRTISNYSIRLDDAVLEAITSSDEIFDYERIAAYLQKYGDNVSRVPSSIKATLIRLSDRKLIKRVGSGCYMRISNQQFDAKEQGSAPTVIDEKLKLGRFINANIGKKIEIRYKTNRLNSDKRWRSISIRGQDGGYIYTNDTNAYGLKIKYKKDKVVDYRELNQLPLY